MFAFKRDWIRGLIFSYAGSDAGALPGVRRASTGDKQHHAGTRRFRALMANTYHYLYVSLLSVGVVSLVLYGCMRGYAPFGVQLSFLTEGIGATAVLTHHTQTAMAGEVAAFRTLPYGVQSITVGGARRIDGQLHYYASTDGIIEEIYPGQTLIGRVIFSIPLLGLPVRMLSTLLGVMLLIWAPLIMLAVDMGMVLARRFRATRVPGMLETAS